MKVFISWSGDVSRSIAEILRQWIPRVIQAVKPYYTPDDISKGSKWGTEISRELDESRIGIICLTRDNLEKPWIMFEAGALSKNIERSKVCPILFGVETSAISGPLIQFQAATFSKNEMLKVVKMMNDELGENKLNIDVLMDGFDIRWPSLEKDINLELSKIRQPTIGSRSDSEILKEVLDLTRSIAISQNNENKRLPPLDYFYSEIANPIISKVDDLRGEFSYLKREITKSESIALFDPVEDISRELNEISRIASDPNKIARLRGGFSLRWKLKRYRALVQLIQNDPSSKSEYITMDRLRGVIDEIEQKLPPDQ